MTVNGYMIKFWEWLIQGIMLMLI